MDDHHIDIQADRSRLYFRVLAPSLIVIIMMGLMAWASVKLLGAARAYVGGESLWSKGRAEAVEHLRAYAATRNPAEFALFSRSLSVPLGDKQARLEMSKPDENADVARAGLIAGGNHVEDIPDMMRMFHLFGNKWIFKPALDDWVHGDGLIEQLQATGTLLRHQVETRDAQGIPATLKQVDQLDNALLASETHFSASLGEASRLTGLLLMIGIGTMTALLALGSVLLIRKALQEQTEHHEALARANRRWELAVAGSNLGLFELNARDSLVALDARAAAIYGLAPQPVTLHRDEMARLFVPEDVEQATRAVQAALREPGMFKFTTRILGPDGQARHVETTGRELHDDVRPQSPLRLIGVVRDITQEVARAQLAMERDAAERVAESQRQFLSRLSHELRTPLNAILGFAQLLAMDRNPALVPSQQKQVKWILDAGDQLLNLVEDVLDLSKVETGEVSMHIQPCSPAAVLRASLNLIEGARQRFDIEIVNRLSDDTPYVLADPKRLQQVFINLLSNGCKYNVEGGHLFVDAQVIGNMLEIAFEDNGIGLSPEDAAELFQAFRRVVAVSSKVEGSGLGLYIVKQLVERMAGSVEVRSEPGKGSRFSVRLPLAPQ